MENVLSRLRVPVRATLILAAAGAFAKAAALFTTPLFTRALTPAEYGCYPLYQTWLGVLTSVFTLGIGAGVLYRGIQRNPAGADAFVSGTLSFCFLPLGLLAALLALFPERASVLTGLPSAFLPLLCLQAAADTVLTLTAAGYRYRYRPWIPALLLVGRAIAAPLLAWVLIRYFGIRAEARALASAATAVLLAVPCLISLFRKAPPNAKNWRFLCRFQFPLLPHFAALALLAESSRLLVGRFLGAESLAPFSLAVTVGLAPTLLSGALLSVYQPWLMRKTAAGKTREIVSVTRKVLSALAIGVAGLLLFLPEAVAFLAPASYAVATRLAVPISLTVLPLFLYPLFASVTLMEERTGAVSLASSAAALLSLAVDWMLIPTRGVNAAAWLMPLSYGLLTLFHWLALGKKSFATPEFAKNTLQIAAFTVIAACLIPFLYPYFSLRLLLGFSLAAALAFLLLRNRALLFDRAPS